MKRSPTFALDAVSFSRAAKSALRPEASLGQLHALLRLHVELNQVETADGIVRGIFTLAVFGAAYGAKER